MTVSLGRSRLPWPVLAHFGHPQTQALSGDAIAAKVPVRVPWPVGPGLRLCLPEYRKQIETRNPVGTAILENGFLGPIPTEAVGLGIFGQ